MKVCLFFEAFFHVATEKKKTQAHRLLFEHRVLESDTLQTVNVETLTPEVSTVHNLF